MWATGSDVMDTFLSAVDDNRVQYVLGMRKAADGDIEYLVRYHKGPQYDRWEKAANLTCASKIMAYYEGQNPKGLVPNPAVEASERASAGQSKPQVLGIEKTGSGPQFKVQFPNETEPRLLTLQQMREQFPKDVVEFCEKSMS